MKPVLLILSGSLLTTACTTTQPYEAAGIDYHLPKTNAAVSETLTLTSCGPISTEGDLTLEPKAAAQDGYYHLSGEQLASARIKRDIKVDVSDKGVITGINSANEDKTPEIVANVIKTAGAIAGMAAFAQQGQRPTASMLVCRPEVADAVARASWLKKEIVRLRAVLVKDPRNQGAVKALNRAAAELARLQEGILKVETGGDIDLERPGTATETPLSIVDLDFDPFDKWFETPAGGKDATASYQAALLLAFGLDWKASLATPPGELAQPTVPAARSLRSCGFAIAVPAVVYIDVDVVRAGSALPDGLAAKKQLPAAQWARPNKLCFDVGFGEQRNIDLTFNDYGQTTEFHWASEARGATVSGALAGYAPDIGGIVTTLRGRSLASKKAEIDEIETQQKLDEARRCKRIRDAGGDCAASE